MLGIVFLKIRFKNNGYYYEFGNADFKKWDEKKYTRKIFMHVHTQNSFPRAICPKVAYAEH